MKIKFKAPDGKTLLITVENGLPENEIQNEIDKAVADYMGQQIPVSSSSSETLPSASSMATNNISTSNVSPQYDEMMTNIGLNRESAIKSEYPITAPFLLGASKFTVPQSYQETMQTGSTTPTMTNVNEAAPMIAGTLAGGIGSGAAAALPTVTGRIAGQGAASLGQMLTSDAVTQSLGSDRQFDLGNYAIAGGLGVGLGGIGEGISQLAISNVMKQYNLSRPQAIELLKSKTIGALGNKQTVIDDVNNQVRNARELRSKLLSGNQNETKTLINIKLAKDNAKASVERALRNGDIDGIESTKLLDDIDSEFSDIMKQGKLDLPNTNPEFAYNRMTRLEKSIPKTAEGIEDIKTGKGMMGYYGSQGLESQLKNIPEYSSISNLIQGKQDILQNLSKMQNIPRVNLLSPQSWLNYGPAFNSLQNIPKQVIPMMTIDKLQGQ